MRRFLAISTIILLLSRTMLFGAGGLGFHGLERPIDDRTSMAVRHINAGIRDSLVIRMAFRPIPDKPFGQICRIRLGSRDDSPAVILQYDGYGSVHLFQAIWEGRRIIARTSSPMEPSGKPAGDIPLCLTINLRGGTVTLRSGTDVDEGEMKLPTGCRPSIVFGRDGDRTDVPSMELRDISIRFDARKPNHFALGENAGGRASCGNPFVWGSVTNPEWLAKRSYQWKQVFSRKSTLYQSAGYNRFWHEIYTFDRDSIVTAAPGSEIARRNAFKGRCPVYISLGSSFIDPSDSALISYEPYVRRSPASGTAPSLARLNRDSLSWEVLGHQRLPQHMHHHNCVTDAEGRRVFLYGGFGMSRYNGDFYRFNADSLLWSKMSGTWGDPLWPRFQGSMGFDSDSGLLYIYGGVGNESGEQIVGRQYFYTLHRVDPDTGECKKLWEIDWKGPNAVAVRDMVFDGEGHFYTFVYTESITESKLHLYRFNISDGRHEEFAEPLPIYSDRITCLGNIYLDKEFGKLVAIVEESTDDVSSTVTAYTLDFPPAKAVAGKVPFKWKSALAPIFPAIAAALFILLVFIIVRWHRRLRIRGRLPQLIREPAFGANSILLFGDFKVSDKDNGDITSKFSGKIRQLLYILIEGQPNGGVTSDQISSLLWPDKDVQQAKNIRGVTINSLRKALANMEGVSLIFEDGRYSFSIGKKFSCDYLEFLSILSDNDPDMDRLLGILSRGKLLQAESDPIFDKMKNETEQMIEPVLLQEMPHRYSLKQFQSTILCANILFKIDPLNESALAYTVRSLASLGKKDEAKARYQTFAHRYLSDYNEPFRTTFEDLMSTSYKG